MAHILRLSTVWGSALSREKGSFGNENWYHFGTRTRGSVWNADQQLSTLFPGFLFLFIASTVSMVSMVSMVSRFFSWSPWFYGFPLE